jgi:hypothetical protein
MVETIRMTAQRGMPIVAGGAAEISKPELAERTGADLATSDLDEALCHCRLSERPSEFAGASDGRSGPGN